MRSLVVFVAGILIGSAMQVPTAQQSRRLIGLNHVALSVQNFDEAVKFYTNTLGMKEAFAFRDANGAPVLTYLQISRDTFLELQPATATRPPGISHIGLQVDDMSAAVAQFRQGGLSVQDPTISERTRARLAQGTDPNGVRIELLELGTDSSHRKAMDAWK